MKLASTAMQNVNRECLSHPNESSLAGDASRPPSFIISTSLDAELLALASAATEAVGQSFRQLLHHAERAPRVTSQPDGRVAHNQKLPNHPRVSIQGLSPPRVLAQGRLVNEAHATR